MTTACKTKKAVLLLACRDSRDLWRFPTDDESAYFHGFTVALDFKTPVYKLMVQKAAAFLGVKDDPMSVVDISLMVEPLLQFPSGEEATLFVGQVTSSQVAVSESWPTLPDILRKMDRNKNRIAYLKALQVLAGTADDELHAVEIPSRKED